MVVTYLLVGLLSTLDFWARRQGQRLAIHPEMKSPPAEPAGEIGQETLRPFRKNGTSRNTFAAG
jgi:hypothetical protein